MSLWRANPFQYPGLHHLFRGPSNHLHRPLRSISHLLDLRIPESGFILSEEVQLEIDAVIGLVNLRVRGRRRKEKTAYEESVKRNPLRRIVPLTMSLNPEIMRRKSAGEGEGESVARAVPEALGAVSSALVGNTDLCQGTKPGQIPRTSPLIRSHLGMALLQVNHLMYQVNPGNIRSCLSRYLLYHQVHFLKYS